MSVRYQRKRAAAERLREGPVSAAETVRGARRQAAAGRLAGVLFVAGSLGVVPSTFWLAPRPPVWVYLLTLLGVVSGVVCLRLPWGRLSARWLDAVPAVATVEVSLLVWAVGSSGMIYTPLYVLVAVFAASALCRRAAIAAQVALVVVALLAVAIVTGAAGQQLVPVLIALPVVCVAAVVVAHLREALEAGQESYRRLAGRDPLTGVGNYRVLHERLEYELVRHRRHERPLTVILVDLDGFKAINDTYGHPTGDEALRRVALALAAAVRAEDTLARQGGDEFSVLAPETDRRATVALIERITRAVATVEFEGTRLRASIGAAAFPHDGRTADELIAAADHSLRAAKPAQPGADTTPTPTAPPEAAYPSAAASPW